MTNSHSYPMPTLPASPSRRRGFLFTLDALLALALLVSAFSAVAAFTHLDQFADPAPAERLARDYLELKYGAGAPFPALTPENFSSFTNYTLSENATNATALLVAHALLQQPGLLCGCASYPCTLTNATAAGCETRPETTTLTNRSAWVNP